MIGIYLGGIMVLIGTIMTSFVNKNGEVSKNGTLGIKSKIIIVISGIFIILGDLLFFTSFILMIITNPIKLLKIF